MRIKICDQTLVKKYHLGVATVLDVIGCRGALVTDESTLSEFIEDFGGECAPDNRWGLVTCYELSKLAYSKPVTFETKLWELGSWIEGN